MSTDRAAGDAPKTIELPPNLPQDLRDFLECRSTVATIRNGPVAWVSGRPKLTVKPGPTAAAATLSITVLFMTVSLPAEVADGKLSIDTAALPGWVPAAAAAEIQRFVDGLNGSLAANGKALGPPSFGPDGLTLTKVELAG